MAPVTLGDRPKAKSPEDPAPGTNKFIGKTGEGHRGLLLAVHKDGKRAIMLACTQSHLPEDGVVWGRVYLVQEPDEGTYPVLQRGVVGIPNEEGWHLTATDVYVMGAP